MAKRKLLSTSSLKAKEFAGWNFIIFLTLAFILLVVVVAAMNGVSYDLRTRAGLVCPKITLPAPEACPGGKWEYSRSQTNGCPEFVCNTSPSAK